MSQSRNLRELKEKNYSYVKKKNNSKNITSLSIAYNTTLPNISKIVNRNSNILQINTEFY